MEERYGTAQLIRPRLGQGTFRVAVTGAYAGACAVSREHSLPVLEAAHIRPYGNEGSHDVANALLLRADIHRFFDAGYVTVTPDDRFVVSRRLAQEWENGKVYYAMEGSVAVPRRSADPAKDALPEGQIFHAAGPSEGGWLIVAIHDSRDSWEHFRETILMPRLREGVKDGFKTPPQERTFDVHNFGSEGIVRSSR